MVDATLSESHVFPHFLGVLLLEVKEESLQFSDIGVMFRREHNEHSTSKVNEKVEHLGNIVRCQDFQ